MNYSIKIHVNYSLRNYNLSGFVSGIFPDRNMSLSNILFLRFFQFIMADGNGYNGSTLLQTAYLCRFSAIVIFD